MKSINWLLMAALALVALAGVAHAVGSVPAKNASAGYVQPAPAAPGIPTKVSLSGAASAGTTLAYGSCVRISCNVDCSYRVTVGASTAVVDDNQLPAATPERFCLMGKQDTVTFYSASAGAAYVAIAGP